MKLEIVMGYKVIKEDDVSMVSLESKSGSLGILHGHIPLFAELKIAPLYFEKNKKRESIAVMGGVVKVQNDEITVITEDAARATDIDVLKEKKEKEEAEAFLTKQHEIADMIKAEIALRKALVKLKVVETSKRI